MTALGITLLALVAAGYPIHTWALRRSHGQTPAIRTVTRGPAWTVPLEDDGPELCQMCQRNDADATSCGAHVLCHDCAPFFGCRDCDAAADREAQPW